MCFAPERYVSGVQTFHTGKCEEVASHQNLFTSSVFLLSLPTREHWRYSEKRDWQIFCAVQRRISHTPPSWPQVIFSFANDSSSFFNVIIPLAYSTDIIVYPTSTAMITVSLGMQCSDHTKTAFSTTRGPLMKPAVFKPVLRLAR